MDPHARSTKRRTSSRSSGKENEYPNKQATRKDGSDKRSSLKTTTRGNVRKPREDKDENEKRTFRFILPKTLPGALPCRHQDAASLKNETAAATDGLDNLSSSDAIISYTKSLGCPLIYKRPSAADGEQFAEGKDVGTGGNWMLPGADTLTFSALFDKLASAYSATGNTLPEENGYLEHNAFGIPPAREPETAVGPEANPPSGKGERPSPSGYKAVSEPDILDDHGLGDIAKFLNIDPFPAPSSSSEPTPHADPENKRLSMEETERILATIDPRLLEPWEPTMPLELDGPICVPRWRSPRWATSLPPPSLSEHLRMMTIPAKKEIRKTL